MPEGPEIRLVADRLARRSSASAWSACASAWRASSRTKASWPARGSRRSRRRGKALLTSFDNDRALYSHNQLYGRWYVCAPERPPRTGRSLRVALETSERWALLYSASEIEVLTPEEVDVHPFLSRLGPDLLHERTTPARIQKRLLDPRFRGRSLGGLLLDQGFLAGAGNYLRSEILFFAGVAPSARPKDLSVEELFARRPRRPRGDASLVPHEGRHRAAQARRASPRGGGTRRRWRHAVFARDGHACRRCGDGVRRVEVANRRLYLCPTCQPANPAAQATRAQA